VRLSKRNAVKMRSVPTPQGVSHANVEKVSQEMERKRAQVKISLIVKEILMLLLAYVKQLKGY